jgi:glycosyltransferase involved in cell wall biosynthesis
MLILHVIDSLSPDRGGPPEAVRQLAKSYLQIGARTEVVCLDHPGSPYLKDMPCRVHALDQSYLGRYAFSPRLWKWLDENVDRFDGLVMNGIWSFPGIALRHIAKKHNKHYGIFVHGALDPWFNQQYPLKRLKKIMYWRWQYPVLKDALAVFFTTNQESKLAQKSFRENRWNSVVVPYGITDPEKQTSNADAQMNAFYQQEPELRERKFFLFLARLHEKKGCDLLVRAFARIASSDEDIDLVMAGPDANGMTEKLKRLASKLNISNRVHWTGLLDGDAKWGALRACVACVLPSHQENFGITVVESLAVGRPVLISNQVNICDEVELDGVGFVEDDTLEGTYRLLRKWVSASCEQKEIMALNARTSYLCRYTMNKTAEAINQIFASQCTEYDMSRV